MAGNPGKSPRPLDTAAHAPSPAAARPRSVADDALESIQRAAWRWDFFGALRALECRFSDKPRIGGSSNVAQDALRLCQKPDLTFRASPFSRAEPPADRSPRRLFMNCFGLHGPEGPMPIWLTAYLAELERTDGDFATSRFLDLFNHRLACLVYRAWASAMPAVGFDRFTERSSSDPRDDPFALDEHTQRIASLVSLLPAARDRRWSIPSVAKIHYAGWFVSQARCPEGLVAILSDYFDIPCRIEEFVTEEMELDSSRLDQSASGRIYGGVRCDHNPAKLAHLMRDDDQARKYGWNMGNSLGRGALLGGRVRTCQGRFRLIIGPMTLLQYELLLPDDHAMRQLAEWIKSYVGDEFAWEARLTLHMDEVPDPVMNKSTPRRLGMTSWFHSRAPRHRSDLVIRPRGTSFTFEHQSRNPHGQPRAAAPTT